MGPANVLVAWSLASEVSGLLSALERYLEARPTLSPNSTYFWVSAFSCRPRHLAADLRRVPELARSVKHTVVFLDRWDKMFGAHHVSTTAHRHTHMPLHPLHTPSNALGRARCLCAVYHTVAHGGGSVFSIVLSRGEEDRLLDAVEGELGRVGGKEVARVSDRRPPPPQHLS